MLGNSTYNKIIHQQCNSFLLPIGVFQKGSSRTYIDDNGYFFTVIEFQPSSFARGTYLNIALHFLWNERQYLSYDFPFGQSVRVRSFVEYQNDAQFAREVKQYIAEALEYVKFYRQLCDAKTAEYYVKKWVEEHSHNEHTRELDTIGRLNDEEILQRIRKTRAFWRSKPSMKKMKHFDVYDS